MLHPIPESSLALFLQLNDLLHAKPCVLFVMVPAPLKLSCQYARLKYPLSVKGYSRQGSSFMQRQITVEERTGYLHYRKVRVARRVTGGGVGNRDKLVAIKCQGGS